MAALVKTWEKLHQKWRDIEGASSRKRGRPPSSGSNLQAEASLRVALCVALAVDGGKEKAVCFLVSESGQKLQPSSAHPCSMIAEGQAAGEDWEDKARRRLSTLLQSLSPADLESIVQEDTAVGKRTRGQAEVWLRSQSMVDWVVFCGRRDRRTDQKVLPKRTPLRI